jgi:hypothetical protein
MRQILASLCLVLCAAVAGATTVRAAADQQPAASPLAGTWVGKISSDAGEMQITVVLKVENGKASGSIDNPHGSWPIADGVLKDGTWTLPFTADGAGGRWMKGQIKGDTFSGEWNNAPMAVGTFELTRVKK